jgi:hypothetical protein
MVADIAMNRVDAIGVDRKWEDHFVLQNGLRQINGPILDKHVVRQVRSSSLYPSFVSLRGFERGKICIGPTSRKKIRQ